MTGRPTESDIGRYLLVLRCQTGDERAFAQLFEQFGARTLRYLHGLVGDAADDVHQEVWLTVFRRIADLSDARAFRTWLFRIARHRALDYLRQQRREHELIVEAPVESLDPILPGAESSTEHMLDSMTASLTEIQHRLSALEAMITSRADS